ncbi:putative gtpase activating protein (bud2 cla2) [Phaeomoniella chlamydospora]|uniref:Putative gtpase activating protein (Bud2 cla2) n=1 Tax=Phaeomoniella chlamydospora TaxID=158046 RepID=A0A0G2EXM3_PHACM|nr:putative gtpase activating protein (bud2 cla2) [Phaeomoniella chlamydospora]
MERDSRNAKRRSIVGQQDLHKNGAAVERRTSKKSSSHDRQGRVYPDNFRDTTIRAVTPETASKDESQSETDAPYTPSAVSPSSQANTRSHYSERQQYAGSITNTDSERSSVDIARKQGKVRTKKGDPDNGESSSSPSLFSKTRNRLGSITTNSPFAQKTSDDPSSSIGFPSIHSPPLSIQTDARSKLIKNRPTVISPSANPVPVEPPLRSPDSSSDSNKILTLMNTTCGRMHGILSFRNSGTSSWTTGYCAINVASGSLICQVKGEITTAKTLVPDLRGCNVRTFVEPDSQSMSLNVWTASSGLGIQLKPQVPETFDSWLAALLCWQPIRPKGVRDKMTKPQSTIITERKERRRVSESNTHRNAAIIKVGKMLLWESYTGVDPPIAASARRGSTFRHQPEPLSSNWQRVGCTLHENGQFKLLTEADAQLIAFVQLSQLSRCSIQQLDGSVLGEEFCIAIYPQYSALSANQAPPRPIFLCLESRVLYEVWFVLLRAFTVPELYGPQQTIEVQASSNAQLQDANEDISDKGMFRVERSLSVRVTEAKLKPTASFSPVSKRHGKGESDEPIADFYSEILLDGEVRGRTAIKLNTSKPFWREEFTFIDLPPVLSRAELLIKAKNSVEKEWTMVTKGNFALSQGDTNSPPLTGNIEVAMHDSTYGKVELPLDELEHGVELEKWWFIYDGNEQSVGEVLMKVRLDETVVLMTNDYAELSGLLHQFSNGLTIRIANSLNTEVKQLSEIFLDIFQVSSHVSEWIMALVEEEIDSTERETSTNRLRYSGRIYSNDSTDAGPEREIREIVLRDLGKSAATEANLLFRGNTILTRSFDAHMRRLGKDYLLETIGERLREIDERNVDYHPQPRANRTLTLIAKSLQTMANMTQFGGKEPWMEPMNKFIVSARQEFKAFVDAVCSIPTTDRSAIVSPSYATPTQILGRLPPTSREGFLSLPFLIDSSKNFAALVNLWLSKTSENAMQQLPIDDGLKLFDQHCRELRARTIRCLESAEQAERPTGGLQSKWEQLLEERERQGTFYDETNDSSKPSTPSADPQTTTLPFHTKSNRDSFVPFVRSFSPQQSTGATEHDDDTPPSSASFTWDTNRNPFSGQDRNPETRASTSDSKESSTLSYDPLENTRQRPLPPHREGSGSGRSRLLDFRRKKDRDGPTTPRDEHRPDFI